MTDAPSRRNDVRPYAKSGVHTLKRAAKVLGNRVIDGRTTAAKRLLRIERDLVRDLGGRDVITAQQRALIDVIKRTMLLLDSTDAWLVNYVASGNSLVNKRSRTMLPIVEERQRLADALHRYLDALGLERRAGASTLNDLLGGTS